MFGKRLASSIVLVAVTVAALYLGGIFLWAPLLGISLLAFFELTKAVGIHGEKGVNALEIVGVAGILLYYSVAGLFWNHSLYCVLTVVLTLIGFIFVYVFTFPKFHSKEVFAVFFAYVYAPLMLSFVFLTRMLEYGLIVVWLIFLSSWICDTCAYLSGMALGKHRLAPVLSPKKSIEGAVGGVIGSSALGALYGFFVAERVFADSSVIVAFAVISGLGAVISQVGDLAASGIKRDHAIKDYGKLIPGHGGIMDRFDSVIITAPLIYFLSIMLIDVVR